MIMRYFTVKEANAILPQIKVLVEEIIEKREEIYSLVSKYEELKELSEKSDLEELEYIYAKSKIQILDDEIKELVDTIQNFGVMVKGVDPVLIDFPAKNGEEEILLCWKEDEDEIMYWHGLYEGFRGRKPISMLKPDKRSPFNFGLWK